MSNHFRWLHTEIDRWTSEGLVTSEQAERLRQRYPIPAAGAPWGLIVFASAGAVVIGLGVILLFAYNWDDIPKFGKLGLIFGAVIGAHAGGLVCLRRGGWQARLGEALSLLGTMFYGAAIWLIAQVYHIDEHYPNGFLLWALGALALAWVLESIPQALLATVLFTIWGCSEMWGFSSPNYWAVLAVLVGIGPLAWRRRSGVLMSTLLAAVYLLLIATLASYGSGAHAFTSILAFSALLIAGEKLVRTDLLQPAAGTGPWIFFGTTGFIVCLYLLGFHQAADELLVWDRHRNSYWIPENSHVATITCWGLFALGMLVWLAVARRAVQHKALAIQFEQWLCPIGLIYAYLLAAAGDHSYWRLVALTFNLVFLGIAVMWMLRGCREARLRPTVLGSLMLAALVFARYFDLFQSLASRGLTFLLLGAVLLGEAFYYRRQKQADKSPGGAS